MRQSTLFLIIAFIIICLVIAFCIPSTLRDGEHSSVTEKTETKAPPVAGDFCLMGCPTGGADSDVVVTHHVLKLNNNPLTKFADWVAYKITSDTLGSGCKRVWKADPDVDPEATLHPADYIGMRDALASDRGHQAPLASLCGSYYWEEADYLSNITPQKSDLNEGAWERLENEERNLVKHGVTNVVYSITGPLYEREMPPLPRAHVPHKVPSGYWKIIAIYSHDSVQAAAFAMDQDLSRDADYCDEAISIEAIEHRSHLTFFPELNANLGALVKDSNGSAALLAALGC